MRVGVVAIGTGALKVREDGVVLAERWAVGASRRMLRSRGTDVRPGPRVGTVRVEKLTVWLAYPVIRLVVGRRPVAVR
jgi:hypothetical protein